MGGYTHVSDGAEISDYVKLRGGVEVLGNALLKGYFSLCDIMTISGDALITSPFDVLNIYLGGSYGDEDTEARISAFKSMDGVSIFSQGIFHGRLLSETYEDFYNETKQSACLIDRKVFEKCCELIKVYFCIH